MFIYWDLVRFSFLRFFAYPFEILASIFKRILEVLFLVLFWSLVIKDSPAQISLAQISSYFLIAMGVGDLAMSHWGPFGRLIGQMVKLGQISNYMVKPVRLIPTLYAVSLGRNGMRMFLAIINIIVGVIIFPPKSPISVFLFFLFFATAWTLSFFYNLFEGVLYLNFTEAQGIRNAVQNIIRVFTGALVPIYLFPSPLKEVVRFTPFPGMVYGPISALNAPSVTFDVILDFGISLFWSFLLGIIIYALWRISMKKYEAVGI